LRDRGPQAGYVVSQRLGVASSRAGQRPIGFIVVTGHPLLEHLESGPVQSQPAEIAEAFGDLAPRGAKIGRPRRRRSALQGRGCGIVATEQVAEVGQGKQCRVVTITAAIKEPDGEKGDERNGQNGGEYCPRRAQADLERPRGAIGLDFRQVNHVGTRAKWRLTP